MTPITFISVFISMTKSHKKRFSLEWPDFSSAQGVKDILKPILKLITL